MCKNDEFNIITDKKKQTLFVLGAVAILCLVLLSAIIFRDNPTPNPEGDKSQLPSYAMNNTTHLRINEYILKNSNTFRDINWDSPDWIELYNYGKEAIWLGNIYLSDNMEVPDKFLLPDIYIEPNEYLLILASGKENIEDDYINAPFKLSCDDDHIMLFSNEEIIDIVEIVPLPTDITAGYDNENNWGYHSIATPNAPAKSYSHSAYDIEPENPYKQLLIINEYMSVCQYTNPTLTDSQYDWIELYNPNDYPVNAGDIYLSDNSTSPDKYKLPNTIIGPNEYLLIYASGNIENGTAHASFSLGDNDDCIMLTHKNGYEIDKIDFQFLPEDISAGYDSNGDWVYFNIPTPNNPNNSLSADSIDNLPNGTAQKTLVINEWMPNNKYGILDAEGDTSDWIEIYNTTDTAIKLDGYGLTDNISKPFGWVFPSGTTIDANGYLLVFASQKNEVIDNEIHTNFSLSCDETIAIVEPLTGIIDSVSIEQTPGNISCGRIENGYGYFALPTPGEPNTTSYSDEISNTDFQIGNIYISEVSTCSYNFSKKNYLPVYEYIELYNSSQTTVDLSGYSVTANNSAPFVIQNAVIKPNSYFLIAIKGYTSDNTPAIRAPNLSLSSSGEHIELKDAHGIIADSFDTGYLIGNYSSGRILGSSQRYYFMQKTPASQNPNNYYTSYAKSPTFSHQSGMIDDEITLELSAEPNAQIFYTLNGDIPTTASYKYTQPLEIDKDSIVRAIAISEGKLPSLVSSKTYILTRKHNIPIVCLSSPHSGLFDDSYGIYSDGPGHNIGEYPYFESNYYWDVERQVAFEYYLPDGTQALSFDAAIQIGGGYSRASMQKSLVIRLRDEYGLSQVTYPFFDEGTNDFRHIYLRNAGQDGRTKLKDYFIQDCAADLGNVDMKRGQPVAVYINGQYWGLYNMRDKINVDYLALKYDLEPADINILSEYSNPKAGSNEDWEKVREFCETHDFDDEQNYNQLIEYVDEGYFLDYIIVETFFGNVDTHNINFWSDTNGEYKWRPLLFDLDLSLNPVDYNLIQRYLTSSKMGFHSFVMKSLISSEIFREKFLQRYAYVINEVYTEEYFLNKLNKFTAEIDSEMDYQTQRWHNPYSKEKWLENIETMKNSLLNRRYGAVEDLQEYLRLSDDEVAELFPWYFDK